MSRNTKKERIILDLIELQEESRYIDEHEKLGVVIDFLRDIHLRSD